MSRILVTGGAGFIGSTLVDKLVEMRNEVVVWDDMSTGNHNNLNNKAKFYDISVEDISPEYHEEFNYIYHLAAKPRIQPSFKNPLSVYNSNVTSTVKMLELVRLTGGRLIFISSSSVGYGPMENPYTFSKWMSEECCKMYHKFYNIDVQIVRPFNVYGPRQSEVPDQATLIGAFKYNMDRGKPLEITGSGMQKRDFIHVDDLTDALMRFSDCVINLDSFNIFEIGSGINYSVIEVAKMFDHPMKYIPGRPGEVMETLAENSHNVQRRLAWMPKHNLRSYVESICGNKQE